MAVKREKKVVEKTEGQELQKLADDLCKKFGKNAVQLGCPDTDGRVVKYLPTGSFSLDLSLGGGIPLGRFIEICGDFSASKSTQAIHMVREAQRLGINCAYLDVEGTTDDEYLRSLGVDTSCLLYSNPDGTEEATQMILDMQKSGIVKLAVFDSLASSAPTKELERDMDESNQLGRQASLLGSFFKRWQAGNNRLFREGKEPFTVIGLNQVRDKIGAYVPTLYSPGGRAKSHFATVELWLRRGDWITEGTGVNKEIVGNVVKYKVEKNKTFKRMQTGEFEFYFAENNAGVPVGYNDNLKEVIECGVEWGVINKGGAWFSYEDIKVQGLEALVTALRESPEKVEEIKRKVLDLAVRVRE